MRSLLILVILFVALPVFAAEADPPEIMTFPAKRGPVVFNHGKHARANSSCKTCHDRKGGKIKGLGKEWAHKVCKGCHEGLLVGPVKCDGCHAAAGR